MEANIETSQVSCANDVAVPQAENQMALNTQLVSMESKLEDDAQVPSDEIIPQDGKQMTFDESKEEVDKQLAPVDDTDLGNMQIESIEVKEEADDQMKSEYVASDVDSVGKASAGGGGDLTADEKKAAKDTARNKRKEDKAIGKETISM